MWKTQCDVFLFFNVGLSCRGRDGTSSHTDIWIISIFWFVLLFCIKSMYTCLFICKAVKLQIKQYIGTAYILHHFLLRPLLMLFVVSSVFCGHRCVFMHVSSWVESCVSVRCLCWREMQSINGWGCYPGAWAQPCTHLISPSSLLWQAALGRSFKIIFPWKIQPYLFTLRQTNMS